MQPEQFNQTFKQLEAEVRKVIVGHDDVIRKVLVAFFSGGHVLLEGVPGLGKTLLVKTLSSALGVSFKRIQFTPDLMPSDIVGTEVLTEADGRREFQFKKGPIFAHVVLADEINRATPKTQSAVLEAMEENRTVFGDSHLLSSPFMVRQRKPDRIEELIRAGGSSTVFFKCRWFRRPAGTSQRNSPTHRHRDQRG
jgi:MoxR-like ATPase